MGEAERKYEGDYRSQLYNKGDYRYQLCNTIKAKTYKILR